MLGILQKEPIWVKLVKICQNLSICFLRLGKICQTVLVYFFLLVKLDQMSQNETKGFTKGQLWPYWIIMGPDLSKFVQMGPNSFKYVKMAPFFSNWLNIFKIAKIV